MGNAIEIDVSFMRNRTLPSSNNRRHICGARRFPYDVQQTPAFQLTYVWFVQATFAGVMGSLATDTFYYGSAVHLSGHLRIVQTLASQMGRDEIERRDGGGGGGVTIGCEFRKLLRRHAEVLGLCHDLRELCGPFVFGQFLVASLQLCVVAYQLTLVS